MPGRCQECGQPMTGRTCANCGWNDATVVDEVWGLPAPEGAEPPTPAAPVAPTQIAVPPQAEAPRPSASAPPPPPPTPPSSTAFVPFTPGGPAPSKSRTGVIIGAVVAVLVLGIGAFVVFGGGDDDSSATDDTRTERTDDTRDTEDTEPEDTEPEDTEATEPGTVVTEPGTVVTAGSDDYPEAVRTNFLDACQGNSSESTCVCILEELETVYDLDEFAALEQEFVTTDTLPPTFQAIVAECQPTG